uniref:MARVEL domain-containing protein n=1 Tax=Steinernema glaseri TaxID=37863 RepID=A0A1I8A6Q5_9BILA
MQCRANRISYRAVVRLIVTHDSSRLEKMALNTAYVQTSRGICKIISIIIAFVICSILCANWYGGHSCFGDGRLGFVSGLNFVIVIINIVVFVLNLFNERLYVLVGTVLFAIAAGIMIWFLIADGHGKGWIVGTTVGMVGIASLFLWDLKMLRGEASNTHLPV